MPLLSLRGAPDIGLGTFIFMAASPFMLPIAGALYVRFGSYHASPMVLVVLLLLGVTLALAGRGESDRKFQLGF